MTASSESIDTAASNSPTSHSTSKSLGFALGIAGSAAVATLLRDWWGQVLYGDLIGDANVHSSYNLANLLIALSLAIAVFGWWLTSRGVPLNSVALTLSKTVGSVGCILAGVGFIHLISAKVPGIFGMSVPSYRTTWAPWSLYLNYDVLPVLVLFAMAVIGFALASRLDRPKG